MTVLDAAPDPTPQPWGYWATLAWTLLAAAASAVASVGALALFFPDVSASSTELLKNMRAFGVVATASVGAEIAVLAVAARLRGWRATDYLGLVLPSRREAAIAFGVIIAFALAYDALTYLLGRDVVTPFQIQAYRNARDGGALLLMLIAFVIAAPVGEEIIFRGFLVRGWAQKPRDLVPGTILIAAIWAAMHSQYDWFGVLQIFFIGLVLGWIRWRSGSTLLTIALHALINAWATVQTVIKVDWLS
jgi:hypothetical protein